jgi:hypothetical protein
MRYIKKFTVMLGLVLAPAVTQVATAATVAASAVEAKATVGARDIVQEIINVVGLKPRFELQPADIDNAAAVIYNGERYILYSESFLAKINNAVHTDWGGVSILAHEIGHHLNGHTLLRSGSNPEDELEADEFSGFVLRKMGASLAEAQAAIDLLSEEETSRTHPGRRFRLAAISKGWQSANEQLLASANGPQPDERAIASKPRQAQRETVTTERQVPSTQRVSMDSRSVLTRVNFTKAPREQFYVTTRMNLVHMSKDGVRVIGRLAKTNNPEYPYYFVSDILDTVFVTDEGYLVNKRGQRVGHLS